MKTLWPLLAALCLGAMCGCTVPKPAPDSPPPTSDAKPAPTAAAPAAAPAAASKPAPAAAKEPAAEAKPKAPAQPDSSHMGPRISRSVGEEGGVVVLWPRIIPSSKDPAILELASALQGRLSATVRRTAPNKPVDVRPQPERVCPKAGCKALSAGVLLLHQQGGCAAVALVGQPGASDVQLIPWGGKVTPKKNPIPFRDYPESNVTISDFVPCDQLIDSLFGQEAAVEAALRQTVK